MAFSNDGFDRAVELPPGLTIAHLRNAIDFVEEKAEELIDLYLEQANIFSAVVGIMGVRALDSFSPYKRHKHPDVAQQRFPDLSLKGKLDPPPREALESKGSARPWANSIALQSPGLVHRVALRDRSYEANETGPIGPRLARRSPVPRARAVEVRGQQSCRGARRSNPYFWGEKPSRSISQNNFVPSSRRSPLPCSTLSC